MHPFNCVFIGKKVIDAIGMFNSFGDVLAWLTRLPLALLFYGRNSVEKIALTVADKKGITEACDDVPWGR